MRVLEADAPTPLVMTEDLPRRLRAAPLSGAAGVAAGAAAGAAAGRAGWRAGGLGVKNPMQHLVLLGLMLGRKYKRGMSRRSTKDKKSAGEVAYPALSLEL